MDGTSLRQAGISWALESAKPIFSMRDSQDFPKRRRKILGVAPPRSRAIVLIDGEHYPPVIKRAIDSLIRSGIDPEVALLIGGREKLGQAELDIGVRVEVISDDREAGLARALDQTEARLVIDISDEPVMDYATRCRMASIALWKGATYRGADFQFDPPHRPPIAAVPSIAVIGTGKRTGKTAVSGAFARALDAAGLKPVVVAMGRGGPKEPEVIEEPTSLVPELLLEWVRAGRHAASDYIEDALTSRVPSVGAWRAGGGLAGKTSFTNFPAAVARANIMKPSHLILEGSGAALPPAHSDAGILVTPATIDPHFLYGYFGLYRLLLADLVVITMCEESIPSEQLDAVENCIRQVPQTPPRVLHTTFRPRPLGEISGKRIWFATTAPEEAGKVLKNHLEEKFGAEVIGISHALADRERLLSDLAGSEGADVLCMELKAAAVDIVTDYGTKKGIEIVYVDNGLEIIDSDSRSSDDDFLEIARLAEGRFSRS